MCFRFKILVLPLDTDNIVHSSESLQFYKDAALSVGFGEYYQGIWFAGSCPPEFLPLLPSPALFKIYPIVVACSIWGHIWVCKCISVVCDNEAVFCIINKGPLHQFTPHLIICRSQFYHFCLSRSRSYECHSRLSISF